MIEAYKKFWKGYVDFKGRSTRSDYWLAVLANTIVTIMLFSIVIVVIVLLVVFVGGYFLMDSHVKKKEKHEINK